MLDPRTLKPVTPQPPYPGPYKPQELHSPISFCQFWFEDSGFGNIEALKLETALGSGFRVNRLVLFGALGLNGVNGSMGDCLSLV